MKTRKEQIIKKWLTNNVCADYIGRETIIKAMNYCFDRLEQQPEVDSGVFRFLDSIDLNTLPQEARHAIREAKHLIINSHHPQISEERIEKWVKARLSKQFLKDCHVNPYDLPGLISAAIKELTKSEK